MVNITYFWHCLQVLESLLFLFLFHILKCYDSISGRTKLNQDNRGLFDGDIPIILELVN